MTVLRAPSDKRTKDIPTMDILLAGMSISIRLADLEHGCCDAQCCLRHALHQQTKLHKPDDSVCARCARSCRNLLRLMCPILSRQGELNDLVIQFSELLFSSVDGAIVWLHEPAKNVLFVENCLRSQ